MHSMATGVKASSKSEIMRRIAEETGLSKKDVAGVFDALSKAIQNDLGKKGPGVFNLPGIVKLRVVNKKAQPAREVMDPFKKVMVMRKAKPASRAVRARPLKALKDAVA
jgi:nucleoid DNA-binding protein